jgi:serine/threonine protein kinase
MESLGAGGMGAVYKAYDERLHRVVALKLLPPEYVSHEDRRRRFLQEARAASALNHPHILTVYEFGEDGGRPYMATEYVEGETLRSKIAAGVLPPGEALGIAIQIAEGLSKAHEAGIVHRDLKPENILVSHAEGGGATPRVRLLDFGLAKVLRADAGEAAQTMTTPGLVMGTFGYMPPEQLSGGEVDERSDLFSVAVCCAEALTGERPFRGRTPVELLHSMEREGFRLPGDAPEVRRLCDALRRALAADPARRYPSAAEMRSELVAALRACPPLDSPDGPVLDADTVMLPGGPRRP